MFKGRGGGLTTNSNPGKSSNGNTSPGIFCYPAYQGSDFRGGIHADVNPTYQIGEWHREVELYLVASGIPGTILRPNSFMENLANFQGEAIRAEGKLYAATGDGKVSYIAARDVAAVTAECLINEAHVDCSYDLVGPEAVTMTEVAAALSDATGRHIEYVPIDDAAIRKAMAGAPDWLVRLAIELSEFDRTGRMSAVNGNVKLITHREPQDFRSWAAEHAARFMPATVTA